MALRKFAGEVRPDRVVYTVYIDVVFAVSTIMDMMVLTILNRVLLCRATKRRTLTGAVAGDIRPCVVNLALGIPAVAEILGACVAASSLMAATAHHLESPKGVTKSVTGIYLVSVVLGGVMLVLHEHTRAGYYARLLVGAGHGRRIPAVIRFLMVAGATMACYGFSEGIEKLIRTMVHRKDLYRVITIYGEKKETAAGLIDTDSWLKEPVSSQPVYMAAAGFMKRLCPTVKDAAYVPYQSMGITSGTPPVASTGRMEIKQEDSRYSLEKPLVAVTKQELSPSKEHRILIQKGDQGT